MKFFTAAAITLLSLPAALTAAPWTDAQMQELAESSFAAVIEEYNVPGLVVGVTHRGQTYYYAAGLASREDNTAVSPDTLFELGSVSKLFNVSLAALAEARGDMDLNEQVSERLPDLDGTAFGDLSLMDLATHNSGGLPLQVPETVASSEGLVEWLADWQPSDTGSRSYSNISIGLLGHITANVLSMGYADTVEQDLFQEMGLQSTWVNVPEKSLERYAYGYDRKTDLPIRVNPGVLDAEAYGVKSSARDMVRFLELNIGHADASDDLNAALKRTRQGLAQTDAYVQNMIWEQYPWPVSVEQMIKGNSYAYILKPQPMETLDPPLPPQKNVILNKTGATNGFGAYVALLPGEELGVAVLANRNIPNEARIRATYAFIQRVLADQE
ncbi:class C beta-lactamase [Leisingera methylohalidivorans]|uniref:Beta-lactamase n=1 Tax=Leisingera methylohalidivorans DSM 14336 TaxID=999552 RepID=V9VXS6_9RHOB|nr:class C beta-lactamase [Leisingera methylohalidivorans]AHD03541.1 beta-lactamase [Leisingera methylohalidivorans DSM 14336]